MFCELKFNQLLDLNYQKHLLLTTFEFAFPLEH